ncbi:MAG TPA: DUF4097 family beta strand repeat-containing protein [Planctomycetota bacterium]|nr:DUF4097 family beta strand repeat-containing protein [Planctomycetota bacterium]
MNRKNARTAVWLASWLLPLMTAGCMVQVSSCGGSWLTIGEHSISEQDGKLVVDDVLLPYERWVEVELAAPGAGRLEVETALGPVELQGAAQESCRLSARVHSEREGDGQVSIEGGRLVATSQQGGKVFLDAVKGSVPEALGLKIVTGTGDVSVERVAKGGPLAIDTGTGEITVRESEPASLTIETGTAAVRLERGGAARVRVDSGAGDVLVVDGTWGTIQVEGGTTDCTLQGATAETVILDSGTGTLRLQGCTVGRAKLDSGTGDLVISGGSCQRADLDSGTGDIELLDGARVESQTSN